MVKPNKMLSVIVAIFVLFGSISFNSFAFGEEELLDDITFEQEIDKQGAENLQQDPPSNNDDGDDEDQDNSSDDEQSQDENDDNKKPDDEDNNEVDDNDENQNPNDDEQLQLVPEEILVEEIQGLIIPLSNPKITNIKTTDASGEPVNLNVEYERKEDVYVQIYGDDDIINYYVRVEGPGSGIVGSGGPHSGNLFNLYDVTGFSDTGNNGGVYKVEVSLDGDFTGSETKSDNFKIKQSVPVPEAKGKITIQKIVEGEENPDLSGFGFQLTKGNWQSDIKYTNNQGIAVFDNLPEGNYNVEEVFVKKGYENISGTKVVEIKATKNGNSYDWTETTVDIKNRKLPLPVEGKGMITVSKKIGHKIIGNSGFTFRISNEDGVLEEKITGSLGTVQFDNLPIGTYSIEEINIPVGYEYVSGERDVEIKTWTLFGHEIWTYEIVIITNQQTPIGKGKITIQKIVEGEENPDLSGFGFQLEKGSWTSEIEYTNGEGRVVFDNLLKGDYEVNEVNVKNGYEYVSGETTVRITSEWKLQGFRLVEVWTDKTISITNKKSETPTYNLEIRKYITDETGNDEQDLSGFKFELWTKGENPQQIGLEQETNESGEVYFNNLPEGIYVIIETVDKGMRQVGPFEVEIGPEAEGLDGDTVYLDFENAVDPDPDPNPDPDPDPNPDPDPDTDTDDDEEEEEEIEEVVPEAVPEVVVPIEEIEEEVMEIEEVQEIEEVEEIEEEIPQAAPTATLPRTGSSNPFMFSGLGAILLGLGFFLKKKE